MRSAELHLLSRAHAWSLRGAHRRFLQAAEMPAHVQTTKLLRLLSANRDTVYGRKHQFDRITSVASYQDRVPVVTYPDIRSEIDAIAGGASRVLTQEPVLMLERTSGSTSGSKLIPYTRGLLNEFSAATGPWLASLFRRFPSLHGTTSYWSVSPAARDSETTSGGLRVGFEDDTEYFGPVERWAIGRMLAVPGTVARLRSVEEWRRETLLHLLRDRHLGLVSVWSPSFLTLLMRALETCLEELLRDIHIGRAREIREALARAGRFSGSAIWPRLRVISCWADGAAAGQLPSMLDFFPGVTVQPKGLLATEGVLSFPWATQASPEPGAVAAITGHFLEFIDLQHPDRRPWLAHELRVGGSYSPLFTTSGGLYRYRMMDQVECTGFVNGAPLLRFRGRLDGGVDLVGEKLVPGEVDRALERVVSELGPAELLVLVPEPGSSSRYLLVTDGALQPEAYARALDRALCEVSHHYRYARELGQLGPLQARQVSGGLAQYLAYAHARGRRMGDVKPSGLVQDRSWLVRE